MRSFETYICKDKNQICRFAEVLSPQKELGPQIAKNIVRKLPHLRKVRKSKKIVRKFADLRFEKHICGPPTFAFQGHF
jgi:hypothetical protein